jgi:hypothetical protein
VDQISLPYRIGLVALLIVGGLWFAVLRPKPATDTQPATTAPGVTGLANDVAKAKGAATTSDAANAETEAAANGVDGSGTAPGSAATPSTGTATPGATSSKPAASDLAADAVAGDPSRAVLSEVDAGKVAVVLFWNRKASDDRATRQALRHVERHDGKVVTHAIPVSQVGKYEAITRGAKVLESPTVLVIGAGGKARAITGYTQANEINQLVGVVGGKGYEAKKAFHLTGFAKVADGACRDLSFNLSQTTDFPTTRTALVSYFSAGAREMDKMGGTLKATPAKGAVAGALKASLVSYAARDASLARAANKDLKGGANSAQVVQTFLSSEKTASKSSVAAAKKARVTGCQ